MLVSQILGSKSSQGIISVKPDDTVASAVKIMSDNRIGTTIVSADGASLDGILSERDIVREIGKTGSKVLDHEISSIMTSKILTCAPGDTGESVLQRMTDGRFRHMPVVDDGKMLGLISIGDVVKARLAELSMEKNALQDMIMGF